MIVVYIAGPFRAVNAWEQEQNVRAAESVALQMWAAGYSAICPHTQSRNYQGALPDEVWLAGFIAQMNLCAGVVLVPGWEESEGTLLEIAEARRNGIPVYSTVEEAVEKLRLLN
jgi:hypothetical protein